MTEKSCKQTAVDWLFEKLWNTDKDKFTWHNIIEQAKEMEKQQIIDAFDEGQEYEYQYHINNAPKFDSQTYFAETYGSKGSSDQLPDVRNMVSSQTEISDEEIIKQGFLHSFLNELPDENALSWIEGFKSCIKQFQISNNEIDKAAEQYFIEHVDDKGYDGFIEGAKWYREQLKQR